MATRSLPEEVVIGILSRLPAKDLIRSRCVCKSWLKLLTPDPHFHKLHLHHLTNNHPKHNPSILLAHFEKNSVYLAATDCTESDEAAAVEIQFPFTISSPKFFGTHHGLVCLAPFGVFDNVYVWNPLTTDNVMIPCLPIPNFPTPPIVTPSRSTFGFGFCQVTKQFKVIRILSMNFLDSGFHEGFQFHCSVYTLGTNSWRTLTIPNDIHIFEHSTAFVNNALHWFAARPESFVSNIVLSFDMKAENFQILPHPIGIDYNYPNCVTIGELGGLLCIYCWRYDISVVEIWVMKEYGVIDSWTKQFKFGDPQSSGSIYPLGLANGGEIITIGNIGEIILYNPRTNSSRRVKKFDFRFQFAFDYIGSIVSPRLVNAVNTLPIKGCGKPEEERIAKRPLDLVKEDNCFFAKIYGVGCHLTENLGLLRKMPCLRCGPSVQWSALG